MERNLLGEPVERAELLRGYSVATRATLRLLRKKVVEWEVLAVNLLLPRSGFAMS